MGGKIDRNTLVLAAQTGDPAALAHLLALCQPDARRYAYRHCMASDIDDAVQETLMIVARKVQALSAAAAFSSWLSTVIKHECRKLAQLVLRQDRLDEEMAEQYLESRGDAALRIDLVRALESLPAHYLDVVLLRDFEELTIAEIAARLEQPSGAVKSRLHRARELVREYLLEGSRAAS